MQLGKTIEVIHWQRHPHVGGHIPVVYLTVPPAATPKMIAFEFARFFGIPLTRRSNITDVLEAVCGVSLDAATTLICVDEIHNLNLGTRHGAEASDTLKYFAERILIRAWCAIVWRARPRPVGGPSEARRRSGGSGLGLFEGQDARSEGCS